MEKQTTTNITDKKVLKRGYLFVPYVFLKKNKNSIFSTRFRLYKKKECERRRRYKINTVKTNEHLQLAYRKHRCSFCRGLYWSVAYYRGYMLCTFCFQKKCVIQYILFNHSDHDISLSEVVKSEYFSSDTWCSELTLAAAASSSTGDRTNKFVILPTQEDEQHHRSVLEQLHENEVCVRTSVYPFYTIIQVQNYKTNSSQQHDAIDPKECYDHEYWRDVALRTFL